MVPGSGMPADSMQIEEGFETLPDEVVCRVARFLDATSLVNLSLSNRAICHGILHNEELWVSSFPCEEYGKFYRFQSRCAPLKQRAYW